MTIKDCLEKIKPVDKQIYAKANDRWNAIAKPLHSLGKLETYISRIAAISGEETIDIWKKILVVFCADNGVVAEGVSQTGQDVTAIVASNFLKKKTCTAIMCDLAHVDVKPIDVGMSVDVPGVERHKLFYGTKDFLKEPAMTREEAVALMETGIEVAFTCQKEGYRLLLTGEMGIGNTTTSSAVAAALLGCSVDEITGRGAGLSDGGYVRKKQVIEEGLVKYGYDQDHAKNSTDDCGRMEEVIDIISKVGGADLAAMCGFYLGAAACKVPVVADGFIAKVAALAAVSMKKETSDYILPSHRSKEAGDQLLTNALHMDPMIDGNLCLGEGSGAVALCPLLDMAAAIYHEMGTFAENKIEAYHDYTG